MKLLTNCLFNKRSNLINEQLLLALRMNKNNSWEKLRIKKIQDDIIYIEKEIIKIKDYVILPKTYC